MHHLIVWWGKREYHTPKFGGIKNGSGSYIERTWYGGIIVAKFPKEKMGMFMEMLSVGVAIGDSYYPIGM